MGALLRFDGIECDQKLCYIIIQIVLLYQRSNEVLQMLKNNIEVDVKIKCIEAGKTQAQLGEAIGTTGQYVNRIIKNSASMPFVSKVVEIDGYKLLDGGVADSIPIMWFRRQGYKKNLVILTRPEGYQKKKMKFQGAINKILHRYPNLAKAMAHRYVIYNKTLKKIDELKEKGEVMVLRPSRLIEVSRLEKDPEKLKALYQLGREDAMKNLDQIHAFLSK